MQSQAADWHRRMSATAVSHATSHEPDYVLLPANGSSSRWTLAVRDQRSN